MLCEKCGLYAATTHIQTNIGGEIKEMFLCSKCAAKYGYTNKNDSFAEMFFSMLSDSVHTHTTNVKKCPKCGKKSWNKKVLTKD